MQGVLSWGYPLLWQDRLGWKWPPSHTVSLKPPPGWSLAAEVSMCCPVQFNITVLTPEILGCGQDHHVGPLDIRMYVLEQDILDAVICSPHQLHGSLYALIPELALDPCEDWVCVHIDDPVLQAHEIASTHIFKEKMLCLLSITQ